MMFRMQITHTRTEKCLLNHLELRRKDLNSKFKKKMKKSEMMALIPTLQQFVEK